MISIKHGEVGKKNRLKPRAVDAFVSVTWGGVQVTIATPTAMIIINSRGREDFIWLMADAEVEFRLKVVSSSSSFFSFAFSVTFTLSDENSKPTRG